jgi:hypothetical protein
LIPIAVGAFGYLFLNFIGKVWCYYGLYYTKQV